MTIKIRQSWESMIDGADARSLAQTDEQATRTAYSQAVTAAIRAEYPDAEIDVEVVDSDSDLSTYATVVDVDDDDYYASVMSRVQEITEDVFSTGNFWA